MKQIKKILFCLIIILISSGCTVDYTLSMNEDESINEVVVSKENLSTVRLKTGLKEEQAVSYLYDMFKRVAAEPDISRKVENEDLIVTASLAHDSLKKYVNNFTSDVFEKVEIEEDDESVTIFARQSKMLGNNGTRSLVYDDINVNIELPFKVLKHNADVVSGNKYTWNIKKNEDLKTIRITYKKNSKVNQANIKLGKNMLNFKYEYIVIGIIIFIVLSIVVIVSINNRKNNRV